MLSACETFAAEIVFAAGQTTFLCFVVWLFGFFFFTARASPPAIIRLLGKEHDTKAQADVRK